MEEENEIYEQCPNCNAIWGCEEFDFQECDCCGWPDCDDYNELNEWNI